MGKSQSWLRFPPLVSVVMPTRDRPALLDRAAPAGLDQDYPGEIECVVVFEAVLRVALDVLAAAVDAEDPSGVACTRRGQCSSR